MPHSYGSRLGNVGMRGRTSADTISEATTNTTARARSTRIGAYSFDTFELLYRFGARATIADITLSDLPPSQPSVRFAISLSANRIAVGLGNPCRTADAMTFG